MEENPPTPAGRDTPRSRTPRAAFSTPEQPAPPSKPAERAPRRAAKAAPPVTFQPPSGDSQAGSPGRPPSKTSSGTRGDAPAATPADQPQRQQPKRPRKATPRKAPAAPAESPQPAKATAPAKKAPAKAAKTAKATPAKKTARKATRPPATPPPARSQALAAEKPTPPDSAPRTGPAPQRTEPWAKLVADPGHTPELLALAAVQTIGPRAQQWADRIRAAYPSAGPDALARLAQHRFTRFGSVSSVFAAVAGTYAPVALMGSNAITYAELVLHIAAAYGLDPADERRATDLLVLTEVHPTREDAETAVHAARQPAYSDDATLTDAVWRLGRMVAAQAGVWAAVKAVNRVFPGTAMLAAVITSRSGARTMAGKATAYYRAYSQESQSSGASV